MTTSDIRNWIRLILILHSILASSFSCLLTQMPPEILDSVVVHELSHRKHMNHSKEFYAEILRVMPDYYERERWLKKNGVYYSRRLPR